MYQKINPLSPETELRRIPIANMFSQCSIDEVHTLLTASDFIMQYPGLNL